MYEASLLAAAVVLPKCVAAATACSPSRWPVALAADAALLSYQTPARAPPCG